MTITFALAALAAAQAATAAPVDHSKHNAAQHAQHQKAKGGDAAHQGEHKCCKEVDGKMVCEMMQGHGAKHQGKSGHNGHGTSH